MMKLKRFLTSILACSILTVSTALPTFAASTDSNQSVVMPINALSNSDLDIKQNSDGGYSISIGDQEWTFHLDQEETIKMEGIVSVPSGSCLRLREGPSVDTQILAGVNNGGKVEVLEKQGEWYKVKYNDKTGYMHEDYLKVTETTIQENSSNSELFNTLLGILQQSQNNTPNTPSTPNDSTAPTETTPTTNGLTPPGNMSLLDDYGSEDLSGQQFVTLVTKAGNTFYLVIDRDKDGNENVHFMNLVDEQDLFALLDDEAKNQYQEQQKPTEPLPTVPPTTEPLAPPVEEPKDGNPAALLLVMLLVLGGAGFAGYSYLTKKKQENAAVTPDPDADYLDDEEEYDFPEDDEEIDEEEYVPTEMEEYV